MSVAINNQIDTESEQSLPWYRYGWPWFLISIPFVSVALGSVMLYLALSANNSMVVDDYYKEGKAINLRIERDRKAALLGLQAQVSTTSQALIIEVGRQAPVLPDELQAMAARWQSDFSWPESLEMKWVHVTEESRDGSTVLQFVGGDRYVADDIQLPGQGKYRVHLQPHEGGSWRLVGPLTGFINNQSYSITAPLPTDVYSRAVFEK